MADIQTAMKWLEEGKKVHRPGLMVDEFNEPDDEGMEIRTDGYLSHILTIGDIQATDWEIYGSNG